MATEVAEYEIVVKDSASDAIKEAIASLNRMKEILSLDQQELVKAKAATEEFATAVTAAQSSLTAEKGKLEELIAAKDKLTAANQVDSDSYKKLQKQIEISQKTIKGSQDKLTGAQDKLTSSRRKVIGLEDKIASGKNKIAEKYESIKKSMGSFGQSASAALGKFAVFAKAALIAVALAIAAAGAALIKFAADSILSARNNMISVRAVTGHAVAAKDLEIIIERMGRTSALTNEQLQEYALSLLKARVYGMSLTTSMQAISTAATVMGESAGKAIEGLITQAQVAKRFNFTPDSLKETGLQMTDIFAALSKNLGISMAQAKQKVLSGSVSVQDGVNALATGVEDKFGELAKMKALDPTILFKRFKNNIANLFTDVNVEPLLEALGKIASIFDSNTEVGKLFKTLITSLLNPLMDKVSAAIPYIEYFFLLMISYTLKTLIALKPLYDWIKKVSDSFDTTGLVEFEDIAKIVFGVIAVAIGGVVLAWLLLYNGIKAAITIVVVVYKVFAALFKWLGTFSLVQQGVDLVKGMAEGIKKGIVWVVEAIVGLGKAAIAALKTVLDSHSPSKVFEKLGGFTAEGFTVGVQKGTPEAVDATSDLANLPTTNAVDPVKNPLNKSNGNNKSIHIENINFAGSIQEFPAFKEQMTQWLREQANILGLDIEVPA